MQRQIRIQHLTDLFIVLAAAGQHLRAQFADAKFLPDPLFFAVGFNSFNFHIFHLYCLFYHKIRCLSGLALLSNAQKAARAAFLMVNR